MATKLFATKRATQVFTNGDTVEVYYHSTCVFQFNRETKEVVLRTGGHWSHTTKTRINQCAELFGCNFRVYQKDFAWFVCFPNTETPEISFDTNVLRFTL